MSGHAESAGAHGKSTEHSFSCAVTAVLLARVRREMGEAGVALLLEEAAIGHSAEYLQDVGNWIGFDETVTLWRVGERLTHDPRFACHVGEDAVKVLGGSATATTLRSLGSIEEHLRRLDVSGKRWSTAADLKALEVRPGYAELRAVAVPGLVRYRHHCEFTCGMLSVATVLFGLPPARVEHSSCQAVGAEDCRYFMYWDADATDADDSAQVTMLRAQLSSLSERLEGVFATASDLISTGDLEDTLSRIADRAGQQVRAPKYLLAVRAHASRELVCYQKGLDPGDADRIAARVFSGTELPENWCAATVRSRHRDYGRLVAMYDEGAQFFPQERELLELYARYAATALDSATALLEAHTNRDEAQRRHEEARALLELARLLASAGSTDQIASRLVEAIPSVIDCDRVSVFLWDQEAGELTRQAVNSTGRRDETLGAAGFRPESIPQLAAWLERPDSEPWFIDAQIPAVTGPLREIDAVASVAVPIATPRRFLGAVVVSVRTGPERLAKSPELCDRLSGVAAHAVIALENGRLVDHITHQARHDQLTGLANRLVFGERVAAAAERGGDASKPFALFYIDLDRFKPVNDELGHDVGDALLRAVAERLHNCARPDDTVARLGGDEFAVVVDSITDESQLEPIAERFQKSFESPFVIDGHTLSVGASIGQAVWPIDGTDVDGLLREADSRMYRVKHSRPGRGSRDNGGAVARPDLQQPTPAQAQQNGGSPAAAIDS
jgi:diguanylate cyclase (GGDEF)-like protein